MKSRIPEIAIEWRGLAIVNGHLKDVVDEYDVYREHTNGLMTFAFGSFQTKVVSDLERKLTLGYGDTNLSELRIYEDSVLRFASRFEDVKCNNGKITGTSSVFDPYGDDYSMERCGMANTLFRLVANTVKYERDSRHTIVEMSQIGLWREAYYRTKIFPDEEYVTEWNGPVAIYNRTKRTLTEFVNAEVVNALPDDA